MGKKQIKVGVRLGEGPPPGYKWNVGILDFAFEEVMGFLTVPEYQHISMQIKELAREQDPTHSDTSLVKPIEDYFELCEKGGILGKKNVRVFFGMARPDRLIVILGGIKKENNGPTPEGAKVTMRRRWRKFKNGDYGVFSP